jgi:hypothetical protein
MNRELPNGNEEKKIIQTSNFNVEIIYFYHCVDASASVNYDYFRSGIGDYWRAFGYPIEDPLLSFFQRLSNI